MTLFTLPTSKNWSPVGQPLLMDFSAMIVSYIPNSNDLQLRVLHYKHDHILSGHPGQNKTVDLICRNYTWPGLCKFVKKYCKSCTTCMWAKPQRHKPYGLLKQLLIPECPWNSISMDFIETLLMSSSCDSILVIVDQLSKQGIFIPTTIHCTFEDLAMLFVMHMFSKHGDKTGICIGTDMLKFRLLFSHYK